METGGLTFLRALKTRKKRREGDDTTPEIEEGRRDLKRNLDGKVKTLVGGGGTASDDRGRKEKERKRGGKRREPVR